MSPRAVNVSSGMGTIPRRRHAGPAGRAADSGAPGLVLHSSRVRPHHDSTLVPTRRTFLGAAAATALRPPPAWARAQAPRPSRPPPTSRRRARPARRRPTSRRCSAQMTLDEKIGQMTQADKNALKDGREVHEFFMGSVLSGGDSLPKPNDRRHLGRDDRPLPEPGAVDPARHPNLLRRRRGPRRRRRQGRGALPAPHRHGRHPQPRDRPEGGARDGARGRRHRRALDVRPLHRGRARRALGPHLRELRRVARAGRAAGAGRRPRLSGRPSLGSRHRRPRQRQALPRRRRHLRRQGPGGHARHARRSCARSTSPATSPASRPASAT